LQQRWESSPELSNLVEAAQAHGIKIDVRSEGDLKQLAQSHQGVALFSDWYPELNLKTLETCNSATLLLLDGLEDPHNLGAILRSGWLMGVQGALIPKDRAVGLTPTVHKVACGGVEHVPVLEIANFAPMIEDLKKWGFWILGLSHEATKTLYRCKIPEKVVWIIGSEDRGMRKGTEKLCDELLTIPQTKAEASYNASVAAAITLSETQRQRLVLNP
jgi:23S rRNA (guanosine2251-2'-O)-methyltransferase